MDGTHVRRKVMKAMKMTEPRNERISWNDIQLQENAVLSLESQRSYPLSIASFVPTRLHLHKLFVSALGSQSTDGCYHGEDKN